MNYAERKKLYAKVEADRGSRVLAYVTGDRRGMETRIADDCMNLFVDLLDDIGPTKKITLILHTNGGETLAAWRLVNMIRTFCDDFEVIVPMKALSAGTLICIGSDRVVMTKQAALGPIDPSVNHPLNPQVNINGAMQHVSVSVEAVRGYLDAARSELNIKGRDALATVLINLAGHIHPLVIGEIFRSRAQIRFLADKLISRQVSNADKKRRLIDFLCADSGSHDYTINRREAAELGLSIEKPSSEFYKTLRAIHQSYVGEMKLLEPYTQQGVVGKAPIGQTVPYTEVRGLIEGSSGACYAFVSEGKLTKVQVPTPAGVQDGIQDERTFEGWRRHP